VLPQSVNKKHRQTLEAVFAKPEKATILWDDIEDLFVALGGQVSYGGGSAVRVVLNGVVAVFHRPHPQKDTYKSALKRVRRFLTEAGYSPEI
jgi:hypothetical protein